jgi:hypothetical protein
MTTNDATFTDSQTNRRLGPILTCPRWLMLAAENRSLPVLSACKRERTRLRQTVTCKQFFVACMCLQCRDIGLVARDASQHNSHHVSTRVNHTGHAQGLIGFKKRIHGSCTTKSRQIWGCKIDAVWRVETSLKQPQP